MTCLFGGLYADAVTRHRNPLLSLSLSKSIFHLIIPSLPVPVRTIRERERVGKTGRDIPGSLAEKTTPAPPYRVLILQTDWWEDAGIKTTAEL